MDRILNMIIRMVIRRGMSMGVKGAMRSLSKGRKPGPGEDKVNASAQDATKRARLGGRAGRF